MRRGRRVVRLLCGAMPLAALLLGAGGPGGALPVEAQSTLVTAPTLVKTPEREQVWLVDAGRRFWVADGDTFSGRGFRWEDVRLVSEAALRSLPPGPAVHGGALLREESSGDVYLIADGRTRRIPDPVSFTEYGLQWGRVETVRPEVLARLPSGAALPHAVTGQTFPAVPAALEPLAGRAGAPVARPDGRLAEPLRLVRAYPPTATWPDFLERFGVTLRVAPIAGGLASYREADRTLTVDPAFAGSDPRAVATLLVHETLHAIYDAGNRSGDSGRACIDEEVQAFAAQSAFWAHKWGPAGRPDASSELERELNRTLQAAADGVLPARVINTFGYTMRCYFPDGGGASGQGG